MGNFKGLKLKLGVQVPAGGKIFLVTAADTMSDVHIPPQKNRFDHATVINGWGKG